MIIQERLTFGQTYVVRSDGPIKITQTGAHGTLVMVNVTDEAGTAGREVVFTAIDTAATVEVDAGTNWSCVPGFNRGAASVQGGPAELPAEQVAFLQAVTDGKLMFDADGRLQIATSVDAAGTFNHDGYASNYTKTVDGVKYTTTVSANEVKVTRRENGTDTVVMHLTNGDLSLQGARVLTESGEQIEQYPGSESVEVAMRHGTWAYFDAYTESVSISPAQNNGTRALTMVLVLTPAADMPAGWLTVPGGTTLVWLYGEPVFGKNYRYEVALTQTSPARIEARVTSITLA